MKRLVLVFCAASVLVGCVSKSDYDAKVNEIKALQASLDETKRELEEIKFGPSRMYQQAKSELDKGAFDAAINSAKTLLDKHPASSEAKQATQLIAAAKASIEKQEAAKRQAEERAKREAEAKKRAEEQRIANALHNMRKKHDEVEGVTWYYDKSSPHYLNDRSDFQLYIGHKEKGAPWMWMRIQYVADSWLFIKRFIFLVDGKNFEIEPPQFNGVERDNGGRKIWEWYGVAAEGKHLEIAKAVAESKKAILRYEGRQYRKDREITAQEKRAIKNVLSAHEFLSKQ